MRLLKYKIYLKKIKLKIKIVGEVNVHCGPHRKGSRVTYLRALHYEIRTILCSIGTENKLIF
jgi:hypothetical protein